MRILFEDHHYTPEELTPLLVGSEITPKHVERDTRLSLDYVGYFYNPKIKDCVFILPKVLMDENGCILANDDQDGFTPESLVNITPEIVHHDDLKRQLLEFVYGFSVWVYRGISVYREKNPDSDIAISRNVTQMSHGRRRDRYTFLDIILEILQFNRQEQDYLTFVVKNMHRGMNKINWTRTIAKSQAIIQSGVPIYLNPVNKKSQVNFDEELLIIFYSILQYIQDTYGFRVHLNAYFDIIKGDRFKRYLEGYGKMRLRQIKYKYFSDKALRIWELCYAFFDAAYKVAISTDTKDYLLVHDFHAVFEDMVDELLSDSELEYMKEQEDGKQLDHIYRYHGLTDHADKEEKVYYIGDSKYYPRNSKVERKSVSKQFTYARNLVQYNLDLFFNNKAHQQYRDEITEGYDIVPNFFISARIPDISSDGYNDARISQRPAEGNKPFYISRQFENRLFDRDTILVAHYDVNFLFILALYARDNEGEKNSWSHKVKEQFRKEIREGLEKEYEFYAMTPHEGPDVDIDFIRSHFQDVLGKISKPYSDKQYYSLALSKNAAEQQTNKDLRDELSKYFYITDKPIKLNEDPAKLLSGMKNSHSRHKPRKRGILVGLVKCDKHWEWIQDTQKYNIRNQSRFLYRNGGKALSKEILLVNQLILYKLDASNEVQFIGKFELLDFDSIPTVYNYEDFIKLSLRVDYPFDDNQTEEERKMNEYIVYEIDVDESSIIPLSDKEEKEYKQLIVENVESEGGKDGVPFVV